VRCTFKQNSACGSLSLQRPRQQMQPRNSFGFQASHSKNRAFEPRLAVERADRLQRRPAVKNGHWLRRKIGAQT
jgi:hypothetical protein